MAAEEILRFALFKEVMKPERKKKRKLNNGQGADEDTDEDEEEEEEDDAVVANPEDAEIVNATNEAARERAAAKSKRMPDRPELPVLRSQPEDDEDEDALAAEREMMAQARGDGMEVDGTGAVPSTATAGVTPER